MTYKKYLTATLIALPLLGCTDSTDEPQPESTQTAISFGHSIEAAAEADGSSRAAVTEKEDIKAFRAYALMFEHGTFIDFLFSDEKVIPAKADNTWVTEHLYYWPDKSKGLGFVAYSPEKVEGLTFVTPVSNVHNPQFTYEPPADPARQVDLLFAKTNLYEHINYGSEPGRKVPLTFYHRLIQVYFEVKGDARRVASITMKNVFRRGTFNFIGDPWWDVDREGADSKTSYTVTVPDDGVLGDDQRLMIIPQVTPHDCTLEISFRDGTPARSIPFSFKLDTMHKGGKVYRIVINLENSAAENGGESS